MLFDDPLHHGIVPGGGLSHLFGKVLPERRAVFEIGEKEGERTCHGSIGAILQLLFKRLKLRFNGAQL